MGNVAIYTLYMHHLVVMRKLLQRMNSWMNYLFHYGHCGRASKIRVDARVHVKVFY